MSHEAEVQAILDGAMASDFGLVVTVEDAEHFLRVLRTYIMRNKPRFDYATALKLQAGALPTQVYIIRKDLLNAATEPGLDPNQSVAGPDDLQPL